MITINKKERTFTCQLCGNDFITTATRAKYCPTCRKIMQNVRSRDYRNKKEHGEHIRKIGEKDICIECGKPYVVRSGLQKVCDECRKKYTNQKKVKANNDYRNKTYDSCLFYVPKGEKEKLQEYAKAHELSLNELVNTAIKEYIKNNK